MVKNYITELSIRRLAREGMLNYVRAIDIPGKPVAEDGEEEIFLHVESAIAAHHLLLMKKLEEIAQTPHGRMMVFMPPGSAKALALDTPIPTPTGWKSMGELRVGDRVFDENGNPCSVTWVSPIHRSRPVYRVTTDCGDEIIADQDHEWLVRLCGKRPVFKIKETWELCRQRSKRPMITRAKPLELPHADLPIDPYLLGVWLGDGNSAGMRITSSVDDQKWMRAEIERLGYKTSDSSSPTLFGVLGVRAEFVKLGLINDPGHKTHGRKHIPNSYMRSSIEQRKALLQGLIDTDGTVCKERGMVTFCNTNRELAEQVRELARSLGVKAGWSESRALLNGKDCGAAYKVSFYMHDGARMPRKAELCRNQKRTPNTYIDVDYAGVADTVCIEVDSPSHLFLCGRSMTPTHNSTYASVVFPSYFLGKYPGSRIILASYGDDLARKMGRRTRSIIKQPRYNGIWKCGLSPDSSAANEFSLTNGSEYMAAGILSGVTGNRCGCLIIDDPIKGREQANSETIRQKTWDAYQDDLLTRLIPGGSVIIIQTRWHEDDLSGRILPDGWDGESGKFLCKDGNEWEIVCLQAKCEVDNDPIGRARGEYLWPEWFDAKHWAQFESNPRTWASLYQQRPTPLDGDLFKPGQIEIIDALPADKIKWIRGWDLAATIDGDYTAGAKLGRTQDGGIIIADMVRVRESPERRDKTLVNTASLDGKSCYISIPQDPGQAGKTQILYLTRQLAGYTVKTSPESGDKITRAEPFAAQVNSGNVKMLRGSWNNALIDEMRVFPNGSHDDQIDAMSRAFAELIAPRPSFFEWSK